MPADEQSPLNFMNLASEQTSGSTSPLATLAASMQNEAPNTAKEWKARRQLGFTVELPSGMKVHVRRTFDLLTRLKKDKGDPGAIPNPLAAMVEEMIEGKRAGLDPKTMDQETVGQMIAMFDQTLEAMMIVPRFQARPKGSKWDWEPDEDAIGPFDIGLEDKVFLFQLAQGGTADLATFRQQSLDIVASVSDGAEVQGEAE
jgi:hypothetical protein